MVNRTDFDSDRRSDQLELAIGQVGPGQQWAGPKPGRTKIGPDFSGQNFSSPARPKNRVGRAK